MMLLTIPSPSEEMLYASLRYPDISGLLSFSLEPEAVRVGLRGAVLTAAVVAFLRHTNLSNNCSSLHSLSWMCFEHGFTSSTRSGPGLSILVRGLIVAGLTSTWTLGFLPVVCLAFIIERT